MEANASDPVPSGLSPSDGELVARSLKADRSAFDELIRRYQRQAVAVSYRLLGNSHDALEVTQDAFLKAYGSLATLQKAEAFGGWLMRIE
jgi:RNA polymerase sigma-70 factor (ECF subfamily)